MEVTVHITMKCLFSETASKYNGWQWLGAKKEESEGFCLLVARQEHQQCVQQTLAEACTKRLFQVHFDVHFKTKEEQPPRALCTVCPSETSPQMSHLRAFFCRECRDYALFGVEFYAEILTEILRKTQNFGRKSAENIGWWSLCCTE